MIQNSTEFRWFAEATFKTPPEMLETADLYLAVGDKTHLLNLPFLGSVIVAGEEGPHVAVGMLRGFPEPHRIIVDAKTPVNVRVHIDEIEWFPVEADLDPEIMAELEGENLSGFSSYRLESRVVGQENLVAEPYTHPTKTEP